MPDSIARSAFPSILKRYMDRDNLSQVDIARELNVSKQTVSDWVSGKKFPRVDRMQLLANLFGVLMSDMYTPSAESAPVMNLQLFAESELLPDEQLLLDTYRSLSAPGKQYLQTQLTIASTMFGEKTDPVDSHG